MGTDTMKNQLSGLFRKKPVYVTKVLLKSCDQSPGLNARKTWALLYPYFFESFKGSPIQVHDWDSFLCDLRVLTFFYEKQTYTLYWEVGRGNGYTEVKDTKFPGATHKIVLQTGEVLTAEPI